MDGNVLTVSLGAWMELPNLTLSEWKDVDSDYGKRINASLVAQYYQDYIKKMGLQEHFSNDTVVTGVRKVKNCGSICDTLKDKLNDKCRSQFGRSPENDKIEIDIQDFDENEEDLFIQEIGGEIEENERNGYRHKKTSSSSSSGASTLSEDSESNTIAMDQLSLPDSLSSEKNMSPQSVSTSGYGDSVISSDIGSPFPACGCPQPCLHVNRINAPPMLARRTVSMMEGGERLQSNISSVPSRLLADRSVSMIEHNIPQKHNKKDALSSTRMGIFMRQQSRKRANTTCCLDFAEIDQQSCGITNQSLQASWDPIVYPSQMAASWNATTSGAVLSEYPASERSTSLDSVIPRDIFEIEDGMDECLEEPCEVSKCFPEQEYLWEVSGYRCKEEGGTMRKEEFTYLTSNVVMACGQERANSLDIPGENLPFVLHSLKELEAKIASGDLNSKSDPVIIVGAGLSAADAIIAANEHNLNVMHIFRREAQDRNLIFKNLPPKMYPEYHKIHKMMTQGIYFCII